VFTIRQLLTRFAERLAFEFEPMSVGQEAVEQRICDGRVIEIGMPGSYRKFRQAAAEMTEHYRVPSAEWRR